MEVGLGVGAACGGAGEEEEQTATRWRPHGASFARTPMPAAASDLLAPSSWPIVLGSVGVGQRRRPLGWPWKGRGGRQRLHVPDRVGHCAMGLEREEC